MRERESNSSPGPWPPPLLGHAAHVYNDAMVVFGGVRCRTFQNASVACPSYGRGGREEGEVGREGRERGRREEGEKETKD